MHTPDHVTLHAGFDGQQWYRQLFDYGLPPDGQPSADDPDADLIPRLVQDLVVPLARHALQHAWNPHSRKRTAAAVAVMEEMHVYVDAGSTQLQVRPARDARPDGQCFTSCVTLLLCMLDRSSLA